MSINASEIEYYLQFKNKHVRALAWIIKSPMLLGMSLGKTALLADSDWANALSEQWLHELDEKPNVLLSWINKKPSYRLGLRFELLLIFLFKRLEQLNCIENLHHNVPIYNDSHQTLGELDLLYYDNEKQQRFHWENTVKFFLFQPQEYSFERWVGPNGGDWLQRKMEHLFTRQLGISNTVEAKITLSSLFSEKQNQSDLVRRAFVKGTLFTPIDTQPIFNHDEKQLINPHCQMGKWGYREQFYLADSEQQGRWRVVEKLDWIVPQFYPYHDDDMLKPNEMSMKLKFHFSQSKRSLLLAHFYLDEISQQWIEDQRIMIVDKLWPNYK